jgi:hypothetical protein
MKSLCLTIALFVSMISAYAQKGNFQIGLAGEMAMPVGHFDNDFNTGFGGSVKALYGIGNKSQLTLTTGYDRFKAKGELSMFNSTVNIIPFLAGYRLATKGFYVEPQVGYGLYTFKVNFNGESPSETDGAFTYALGIGYTIHGIDCGVRYQAGRKDSDDISMIGLHIGYNISFRK